jgi:hypothetical protein
MVGVAAETTAEKLAGERPSRTKSLLTAVMVGAAATVLTYRLLRAAAEE